MVVEGGAGLGKIKYLLNEAFDTPLIDIWLDKGVFGIKCTITLKEGDNEDSSD